MNKCIFWLIALIHFPTSVWSQSVENIHLVTTRGDSVEAVIHFPARSDSAKMPAIIIAPGGGYHMDLPIITELAKESVKNGLIAVRFNWHYFTSGGKGSADFSTEIEDLKAVIAYIRNHPRVDPGKLILAGKSNGSIVAYNTFLDMKADIFALFLLTPICNEAGDMAALYPGLADQKIPVVLLLGNSDRMCAMQFLYSGLQTAGNNVTTLIIQGDHGLNLGPFDDPAFKEANQNNISAAIHMLGYWEWALLR